MNSIVEDDDAAFEADEAARIAALHKSSPKTIWLQVDPEAEQFDGWEAQTWCSDQINGTDVKYVRADLIEQQAARIAELESAFDQVNRNRESVDALKNQLAALRKKISDAPVVARLTDDGRVFNMGFVRDTDKPLISKEDLQK